MKTSELINALKDAYTAVNPTPLYTYDNYFRDLFMESSPVKQIKTDTHVIIGIVASGWKKDEITVSYKSKDQKLVVERKGNISDPKTNYDIIVNSGFSKTFNVDSAVFDIDKIGIDLTNGILKISIPFLHERKQADKIFGF